MRYRAELTDERWSSTKFEEETYTNHIKWEEEDLEGKASIKVIQKVEMLNKTAQQIKEKNDSRVKYTLTINQAAKDLVPGSTTIKLTDVLTVHHENVQASLDLASVHLYNTDTGMEVSKDEYGFTPPVVVLTPAGYRTYTTTFTLPDATPLRLEYEYVTDATGEISLSNEADLSGKYTTDKNTTLEKVDATSTVHQASLTIHKVDKRNYLKSLTGATFKLERFDQRTHSSKWVPVAETDYEVDENGTLTFYYSDAYDQVLWKNTLYRLTEIKAPDGYSKSPKPYYFIYGDSGASPDNVYSDAVGFLYSAADVPPMSDVLFYTSDQPNHLFVPNTANSLTIIKHWKDKDNNSLKAEDVNMSTVDVQLYCYQTGTSKDNATLYQTIQLTKDTGWTTVVKIDAEHSEGYTFFIKETNVNTSRYTVTYGQPAGVEVGNTLTLTNTDNGYIGYELPSTGGTGTLPYTAVGGTMMLTALAYSFIHRKRRREGRADD